jgi:hypothetical protein
MPLLAQFISVTLVRRKCLCSGASAVLTAFRGPVEADSPPWALYTKVSYRTQMGRDDNPRLSPHRRHPPPFPSGVWNPQRSVSLSPRAREI